MHRIPQAPECLHYLVFLAALHTAFAPFLNHQNIHVAGDEGEKIPI